MLASSLRQTTLKAEKRNRAKVEKVLTPEEIAKIERIKLIKQQFAIFSEAYPEYVEKNSVRYPIPDGLIEKMPELHGGVMKAKPRAMKIDLAADKFERVLYVWEYCNNFCDFLNTPLFKLEQLEACLRYTPDCDDRNQLDEDGIENLDWPEQMELRHIREKGFHMVNRLFSALTNCYLQDLFPVD